MQKLSYTQKLYYKAIGKLVFMPVMMILGGFLILIYSTHNFYILLQGHLFFIFLSGFMTCALSIGLYAALDKYITPKIDPIFDKFVEPFEKQRDNAKLGIEGEKIVKDWLDEIISGKGWKIILNVERKNEKGIQYDVDAVLVGPKGVFVFEIKNSNYKHIFTTEDHAVIAGERIVLGFGKDPREQVKRNAVDLEKYLFTKDCGVIHTKRALIYPKTGSVTFLGSTGIFIIDNKESLLRYVMGFTDDPRFTSKFIEKVIKSLN